MSEPTPPQTVEDWEWQKLSPANQRRMHDYYKHESNAWKKMYFREYDQNTWLWIVLVAMSIPGIFQLAKWVYWLFQHLSITIA